MNILINIKSCVTCCILGAVMCSCVEDKLDDQSWIPIPEESTQIEDVWLAENLTIPYNMEVKYRWDETESDLSKNMVPAELARVVPLMDIIRKTWVLPYERHAGKTFICTFIPKLMYLIGSHEINDDGTVTEGSAESGRKIIINNVNGFTKEELVIKNDTLRDSHTFTHVMHHEFGHILHQNKFYPQEYKTISKGEYSAQWFNVPLNEARNKGFISSYAMMDPNEDFVEMIAWKLTRSKDEWEALLNTVHNEEARATLKLKDDMVVRYFKESWNVDMAALQADIYAENQKILDPSYDIWTVEGYNPEDNVDVMQQSVLPQVNKEETNANAHNYDTWVARGYTNHCSMYNTYKK